MVLNFPDSQIFRNLPHKVYNHKMYIGDLDQHQIRQYLHFDLKVKMSDKYAAFQYTVEH